MEERFSLNIEDEILMVRFHQRCGYRDILRAIDVIAAYPENRLRFWDVTQGMDVNAAQMRQIAEHSRNRLGGSGKVAIVTAEDLAYGFSRMFQVFRQDERATIMVFRSATEAMTWLREP